MKKFKWPTPGIMAQVKYCETHKCPELTFEMLEDFLDRLEAESDSKISYGYREEIWRKIRLGLPLNKQERLIHDYDLACFSKTGKWN